MKNEDVARSLFAETKHWRDDPTAPDQVRGARRALAQAIWAFDGQGFAPQQEPTTTDFGDPATTAAWQDCFSAAGETQGTASTLSPKAVFILNQLRPQEDTALITQLPALRGATPSEEFGPFRLLGGGAPHALYVFDQLDGASKGFFPPRGATQQTPRGSRFRHAWLAALMFLIAVVGFVGVTYGAYRAGVSVSTAEVSVSNLSERLAQVVSKADPRLKRQAPGIADSVVTQAKLPGAISAPETTQVNPTGRAAGTTPAPTSSVKPARSAAEIETLAANAVTAAKAQVLAAAPLSGLSAAERNAAAEAVASAVAEAVRTDPALTPRHVNLTGWWAGAIALLLIVAALVGLGFWGSLVGVIVDSRNRLSLSRLQLIFWSVFVLSLFAVTSTFLIGVTSGAVYLPQYPWEIWALLGISIGTAPLSGLILVSKTNQIPDAESQRLVDADPNATNRGVIEVKLGSSSWSFLDFFRGEELANRDEIDISRFQYFVITIVLMTVFVGLTASAMWTLGPLADWQAWAKSSSYPHLNETFIALLALSHGGYLGMKALTKPDLKPPIPG